MLPAIRQGDALPARFPTSELLSEFARSWPDNRVCLKDVAVALGDRAYGLLLLIFALPNVVPSPFIGQSGVCGVPMILIASQLLIGLPAPWFPRWIGERSISRATFAATVERIVPWLQKVERFIHPRMRWACSPVGEKVLALFCVILSIILALPIPFVNILPASAITFICLGLIEGDGAVAGLGAGLGIASMAAATLVVGSVSAACVLFVRHLF